MLVASCSLMEPQPPAEARPQIGHDAEGEEHISPQEGVPVCGVVEAISNSSTLNLHHEQRIADDLRIRRSRSRTTLERAVDADAHAAVTSCVREEPHTHPRPQNLAALSPPSSSSFCIPLRGSQLAQGRCLLAPPAQDGLLAGPAFADLSAQAGRGGAERDAAADSGPGAQELEGVLVGGLLRVLCWNVQHKKRIQEIEELRERHGDALCLQEVHNDFQAVGILPGASAPTTTKSAPQSFHKRLSPLLVRWGGVHAPWPILSLPGKGPRQTLGIISVYLPTHGRRSGADRPDEI